MKIAFLPKTKPGKYAVGFGIAFIVFFISINIFRATGHGGGDTFLDNPVFDIAGFLGAVSTILSFILSLVAIIKSKERSILVYIAGVISLLLILLIVGDLVSPE